MKLNSIKKVDSDGTKYYYQNNKLHRLNGPAIEWADGSTSWYKNGKVHRDNGPAAEWVDGSKFWYRNSRLHRVNGPAIVWADGSKEWYINGNFIGDSEFGFTNKDFIKYRLVTSKLSNIGRS